MTASIGPIEHRATRPKESLSAFLSLRMADTPTPSASIKGTVMGPVVTPPESNATARNDLGTNCARTNVAMYRAAMMNFSCTLKSMRSSATIRNSPTPMATAIISTMLGTPGTCSASTCRSGSATVISIPSMKPTSATSHILRERVSALPTYSPIGVMAMSVPRVNSPIPITSSIAPNINASSALLGTGTIRKQMMNTSVAMGSTEVRDSLNFSFSILRVGLNICSSFHLSKVNETT